MSRVSGAHIRLFAPFPHFKFAAVASGWQRVGDLIDSGYEPHTSSSRSRHLTNGLVKPFSFLFSAADAPKSDLMKRFFSPWIGKILIVSMCTGESYLNCKTPNRCIFMEFIATLHIIVFTYYAKKSSVVLQ